jgi:hypothetical protein
MPNTDAGLPFTSMLRRSSRSTVNGPLSSPAAERGAFCACPSVGMAADAAAAESRKARRESMAKTSSVPTMRV